MKNIFLLSILFLFMVLQTNAQSGYVRGAIEEKYENQYLNDSNSALKQWMYGNLMNVKVEPNYLFPQTMNLHVTTYKNDKVSKETDMEIYMNNATKIMAYHVTDKSNAKEDITAIYDYNQNAMISLNKTTMTGTAFSMNAFMSKETQEQMKAKQNGTPATTNTDCKKTGNSKVIQGYKCDEYICINTEKNTKAVMWICPTLFNQNISSSMFKGYTNGYSTPETPGMAMESYFYKNEILETKMEVTSFKKDANINIATSAYKINEFK